MTNYANKILQNVNVAASGCWEWTARIEATGYGRTRYLGKMWLAHRLAWTVFNGAIPEGKIVCHRCDNPRCCNPVHLFLGTHRDNHFDSVAKGRSLNRCPEYAVTKRRVRKLSDADVDAIRASAETLSVLARRYSCSVAHMSYVRRGLRKTAPRR